MFALKKESKRPQIYPKMSTIKQTTLSNVYSWKKIVLSWFKFATGCLLMRFVIENEGRLMWRFCDVFILAL